MGGPALPGPGEVFYSRDADIPASTKWGSTVHLEGTPKTFLDTDPDDSTKMRSGRRRRCLLVRNTSGITLYPHMMVTWQTGYYGRRVNGYSKVDGCEVAGVVDPRLPDSLGVRANDLFWIQVQGPCLCCQLVTPAAGSTYSEGALLFAVTAAASTAATTLVDEGGKVTDNPIAGLTAANVNGCTDGTLGLKLKNCVPIGRAMSTKTSGQTAGTSGGLVLVDLKINV